MDLMITLVMSGLLLGAIKAQDMSLDQLNVQLQYQRDLEEKLVLLQLKQSEDLHKDNLIKSLNEANELLLKKSCINEKCNESELNLQHQIAQLQSTAEILKIMVENKNQLIENQLQLCRSQLVKPSVNLIGETTPRIEIPKPTSCIPFGYYTGIKTLFLPGIKPFRVLCDGQTAGPGWIVIQRRYDGSEDFYRNWADYRNGFGNLEKEFFLGLENIYHLTNYQRYEFYAFIEAFNGVINWARYDNFYIGSEVEKYKLKGLGSMNGSTNNFNTHLYYEFSTYDRENHYDNRSYLNHGGFWYHGKTDGVNPNGRYYKNYVQRTDGLHWHDYNSNKVIKLLLRPYMG
ncbi:ficolin-2-like [Drosophila novamexicana]|uniref:ficolin-2-like n=1 Tax=Drosophila novamexicana TaxID=47314 RepID=UPI0011E5F29C|nr:ficolin-2-like [Drosophila novamexicana]XP_030563992.1 ficolin-2-like [Drosophila novamexicana]